MTKIKTTKKSILEGFNKVISVGYCRLQHLLYFKQPYSYNSGRNGWNCDFFQVDCNTIISSGYSPCGTTVDYEIINKYDNLASEIISNREIPWVDRKNQIEELISKFIEEV